MTHETKNLTSKSQEKLGSSADVSSLSKESQNARRRFIQAGAIGLPVILTLKSRAAWGQFGGIATASTGVSVGTS